jgi:peptidoglycan biosynthesis protein MviN/MurJ (putative lipid II flippase)
MVPASFDNFFLAVAGAGGALIGLLFVAISVNPERVFSSRGVYERQGVAASAFTALINGFFVATIALLPHINAGGTALALSIVGILNSLLLSWRLLRYHARQLSERGHTGSILARMARSQVMVLGSLAVYGFELALALQLLQRPSDLQSLYALCVVLMVVYGTALLRAWELLGAPRNGLLAWLNPVADLDEDEASAAK